MHRNGEEQEAPGRRTSVFAVFVGRVCAALSTLLHRSHRSTRLRLHSMHVYARACRKRVCRKCSRRALRLSTHASSSCSHLEDIVRRRKPKPKTRGCMVSPLSLSLSLSPSLPTYLPLPFRRASVAPSALVGHRRTRCSCKSMPRHQVQCSVRRCVGSSQEFILCPGGSGPVEQRVDEI